MEFVLVLILLKLIMPLGGFQAAWVNEVSVHDGMGKYRRTGVSRCTCRDSVTKLVIKGCLGKEDLLAALMMLG